MPVQAVQHISPPTAVPAPARHPTSDIYSPSSTNTATVTTTTAAAPRSVDVHDVHITELFYWLFSDQELISSTSHLIIVLVGDALSENRPKLYRFKSDRDEIW